MHTYKTYTLMPTAYTLTHKTYTLMHLQHLDLLALNDEIALTVYIPQRTGIYNKLGYTRLYYKQPIYESVRGPRPHVICYMCLAN